MALHQRAAEVGDWAQRLQAIGTVLVWMLPAPVVTAGIAWLNSGSVKQTAAYAAVAFLVSGLVVRFRSRPAETSPPLPVPAPDSTLAMLRDMGFRFDRPATDPNPPRLSWHELEARFKQIPGEVEVIWHQYATGVSWFVYPSGPNGSRNVERFLNEARIAGRAVAALPAVPRKFEGQSLEDDADNWLNVLAALLDSEPHITGYGRDERGEFKSAVLEKVVDASLVACGRFAAGAVGPGKQRPEASSTSLTTIAALRPYEDAGKKMHAVARQHVEQIERALGIESAEPDAPSRNPPIGDDVLRLSWHLEMAGLHVDVTNLRPQAIHDFKLWVIDVRKYSMDHEQFVEVPLFHQHGPFGELQLWPDSGTQATQIGGVTKLFCGSPVRFAFLYRDAAAIWFKGRTRDASVEQKIIREDGIWQVTLRCEIADRRRTETMMFRWSDIGLPPRPFEFPKPPLKFITDAPPPPTTLGGGGRSFHEPSRGDPNAKDQQFADILTERFTYGVHSILHWDRLKKGQELNDDDLREWDTKEQEWTSGVLELLKGHGCNQQMQATFRDIRDVPFTVRHHFRHVSERLGMFAARLDRLRDIINHYATVPILRS